MKMYGKVCNTLIWLGIGTNSTLIGIFIFNRPRGISLAKELLAPEQGICSKELVRSFVCFFVGWLVD
jgi:hypothetical protein